MRKVKIKRRISAILSGFSSLTKKGPSGWMVILGLLIVSALVIMTAIGPWVTPYSPIKSNVGPIRAPPSSDFPMGTNHLGQDMFSRTLVGGSIMLQVSALSVLICFFIGVPLGLFSSYVGGFLDSTLSLVIDAVYAFPGLVIAIAVAAVLGPGVINMALSIAVVYIPSYFRIVRSQVLSIKELAYTEAAKATGAKWHTIISRYIFPNVIPSIVVVVTVNFADAVLTAAGLTFIGLGVTYDIPDWSWDLTNGWRYLASRAWWIISFPGLMIILLALGFTLIGEGLSEILNPKLQR
ncbi:MAG: ABC transporter permease [Candidatus Bathyarchaeota archaeon]|nr:ABC transporter permease [Candidatus Bathyarchaeota archaeon]